jgi:transcriptional repressor NrdR
MRCPYCDADNDRVLDSRASEDGRSIRRRRMCNHCQRRFTTYERVEESTIAVIKKGNVREPFSREKISRGLERACWKRPISAEQIRKIVSLVEAEIYQDFEDEVPSEAIGEILMRYLVDLDQVAYVRFASVYREFKDLNDFVSELRPIMRPKKRVEPTPDNPPLDNE